MYVHTQASNSGGADDHVPCHSTKRGNGRQNQKLALAHHSVSPTLGLRWTVGTLLKSCWQFDTAYPRPNPVPRATGHGRPA